jgi:hypothetical protein
VVAINPQNEAVTAGLSFPSAPTPSRMTAFETSEGHNLTQVYDGQKPETISLAPRSVTTFVFFS